MSDRQSQQNPAERDTPLKALRRVLNPAHFLSLARRAAVCLRERGAERLCDIERVMQSARKEGVRSQKAKHIVLLVKDKVGLKNLYKLISKSYLEHFKRNPIVPKSLIMEHREGLIIGSACASGELFEAMLRRGSDAQLKRLASIYDYLEIQPICNNRFLLDNGTARDE